MYTVRCYENRMLQREGSKSQTVGAGTEEPEEMEASREEACFNDHAASRNM